MEKRSLKRMYHDEHHKREYQEVAGVVKSNIEQRLSEELKKIPEAVELQKKIDENQKLYFNKEEEMEFLIDYGFTDDYGEDYPDYRYSEELYKNYRNYLENFDKILADLYKKKELLESKFTFGKKRKLEDLEWQIKDAKKTYARYLKIQEREEKGKIWYPNGKYVDINKPYKDRMSEIKLEIATKLVEECFNKYPELMLYDFKGTRFSEEILKAIENEQKSRVLTLSTKKGESEPEETVENQRQ